MSAPTVSQSLEARQQAAALTLDNLQNAINNGLLDIPEHLRDDAVLVICQQRVILHCGTTVEDNLKHVERWIERFTAVSR